MKPLLVFFYYGTMLPCHQGNHRFTAAVLRQLVALGVFHVRLLMVCNRPVDPSDYRELCDELVCIRISEIPSFLRWCNVLLSLPGIDLSRTAATSLWLRRKLRDHFVEADCIIFNFAIWFRMIPKSCLRKTMVITHDIMFYRIRSFLGQGVLPDIRVAMNRLYELRILRRFRRVLVLGDYEVQLLTQTGIAPERIVPLGMALDRVDPVDEDPGAMPYDFAFVGGDSEQNHLALERFARLCETKAFRDPGAWSMIIAGGVAGSRAAQSLAERNPRVERVGKVDDLNSVYGRCRVVVGTIPKGGGIKVKVVEAMNYGKPVLATRKAVEGIPCEHGKNVLILEEMEGVLADGWLSHLLSDSDRLTAIGRQAASDIREAFAVERCLGPLARAIQQVAAENSACKHSRAAGRASGPSARHTGEKHGE